MNVIFALLDGSMAECTNFVYDFRQKKDSRQRKTPILARNEVVCQTAGSVWVTDRNPQSNASITLDMYADRQVVVGFPCMAVTQYTAR